MREFVVPEKVLKENEVRITSEAMIPKEYLKEVVVEIVEKSTIIVESMGDIKDRIGSRSRSFRIDDLMDRSYTDLGINSFIESKLGFFNEWKSSITGSIPKNPTERIYETFKVNVSRESVSIFKSLRNKTLKYNSKIGSVNPKPIKSIPIEKEIVKIYDLPKKGIVEDEKVFNPIENLFWSSKWDRRPKKKKVLSGKVLRFKDRDSYNSDPRRIGKPI